MPATLDAIRAQFPILERQVQGRPLCYLDNAATTFAPTPVLEAMHAFETGHRAAVQRGVHTLAAEATEAFEAARASVAGWLGTDPAQIVFTAGTTAGINLLAQSLEPLLESGDEIVLSVAEHHANLLPWQLLAQRTGCQLRFIDVDAEGRLELTSLDTVIGPRCRLVAVTHASNVTGAVTDLAPIVAAARRVGARVLVDGAQAVVHNPLQLESSGVDFYAFSGHKCHGPTGVGVLWARHEAWQALPLTRGGGGIVGRVTLEEAEYLPGAARFEPGTPPIAQAIGLGAAFDWLRSLPAAEVRAHEQALTRQLLAGLLAIPGLRILGPPDAEQRLPLVSFELAACHPHDLCHILDSQGLALRGGHHCAQPLHRHFDLLATTRASAALFNTAAEIDALLEGLDEAAAILR